MENEKQKIYAIIFEYSDDDSNYTNVNVFSTKDKAVSEFNKLVKTRATTFWKLENYTQSQDTDKYTLDTNLDDEKGFELFWLISSFENFYIHDFIELRELELK